MICPGEEGRFAFCKKPVALIHRCNATDCALDVIEQAIGHMRGEAQASKRRHPSAAKVMQSPVESRQG